MRVEAGVCPNCSEVVLRLKVSPEEALARLQAVGIGVMRMTKREFWGIKVVPEETGELEEMLVDCDNPLLPDTTWHAVLRVIPDWDGGPAVVGHQHCQHQLFPTMLKIEKVLGGRWEGYDGGSIEGYRQWKAEHRTPQAVRRFIEELLAEKE